MKSNAKLLWDQTFPCLSLRGEGVKSFLHGQTSADIMSTEKGSFLIPCWLSSTGRVRAILEIFLLEEKADIILLAGDINDLVNGLDRVIFPADLVEIQPLSSQRRVQDISNKLSWKDSDFSWISSCHNSLEEVYSNFNISTAQESTPEVASQNKFGKIYTTRVDIPGAGWPA